MTRRIAVYGGSFDPPHTAHVLVGAYVLLSGEVDELLVIPTYEHALGKGLVASFDDRVALTTRAFSPLRNTSISRIEGDLGGPSRTVHTLEALAKEMPDARVGLVMGAVLLAETPRWHRYERIIELAPPLVVGRMGHGSVTDFPFDFPNVSSSEIRSRLSKDEPTFGL